MNIDKEYLLKQSKTFCILPWIHYFIAPGGGQGLCCLGLHDEHYPHFGNCNSQSFESIWQNEALKKTRRELLQDIPQHGCAYCYEMEEAGIHSFRQRYNEKFAHHFFRVASTDDNGYAPKAKPAYWDIRFSNLCNLSCRMCEHAWSSSWYRDGKELAHYFCPTPDSAIVNNVEDSNRFFTEMEEHWDELDEIYFAGGEPLLMDEHLHILEKLIAEKRTHVRLTYNTNMTKRFYKDVDIYTLWREFDTVVIHASIDATNEHIEYIRHGSKWETIKENREALRKTAPNVQFTLYPTVSIFNIYRLTEIHRELVESGFINCKDIVVSHLLFPEYLSIRLLPPELKEEIRQKFSSHKEWMRQQLSAEDYEKQETMWNAMLSYMEEDWTHRLVDFIDITESLDRLRGEDFRSTFPELAQITYDTVPQ